MARDSESRKEPSKALGDFEGNYRQLLNRARGTSARIILSEAFYVAEEDGAGRGFKVDPYNAIIRELAEEYGARFVPLDQAFRNAKTKRPNHVWTTGDGVHPNPAGHTLIALQVLGALGW